MRAMLVLMAGCELGGTSYGGAMGPEGPPGTPGTPGQPGGGYRWVDAVGTPVTRGGELLYFEEGYAWVLDPETALLSAPGGVSRALYGNFDCSGPEYAYPVPLPRFVFSGEAWGEPYRYFVRPDGAALESAEIYGAVDPEAGCFGTTLRIEAVPAASLIEVSKPFPPWTAPLHPEPVE